MTDFFRRHSLLFTSVILLITSLQLMSASIADRTLVRSGARLLVEIFTPFEKTFNESQQSIRYIWSHYLWLVGVEEERNSLLTRVKALETINSQLVEYQQENERLKALLSFKETTGLIGKAAAVIGRDPSNWSQTITIDTGADHGIRPGLPVVDGNAVVGQVIAVGSESAKVLLLTDSTSSIDALVQDSRASGIIEGRIGNELKLRYVLREDVVQPGDRVVASGLDGIFPKGTLIGVVTSAKSSKKGLFQNVLVKPSVDLNKLETVLVLAPESEQPKGPTVPEDPKQAKEGASQ